MNTYLPFRGQQGRLRVLPFVVLQEIREIQVFFYYYYNITLLLLNITIYYYDIGALYITMISERLAPLIIYSKGAVHSLNRVQWD